MIETPIAPSRALGYSQLYLDFLAEKTSARKFYTGRTADQTAGLLDQIPFDRQAIVGILWRQNESFGSSPAVLAAIDTLNDPRAVCIFAGQQAGLFGGPMMTLLKALAIAKASRTLSAQLHRPVVPIFWIAADDHDLDEVNHTFLLDRQGALRRIDYTARPSTALPLGQIQLEDGLSLEQPLQSIKEMLGETEFTGELHALLDRCYNPHHTFVSAFGRLLAALTADYGLVLFTPNDREVKALVRPFLRHVIEKQDQLHSLLSARNHEIQLAGYHLQVQKQEDSSYLFVDLNGRKPVHRTRDGFTVGDRPFSQSELLDLLDSEPERFSPDVTTRPIFQAWLFPTAVQMGGPSEIAYFAQGNVIFDLFDRPLPIHLARPTLTFVESRHAKAIEKHAVAFEEVAGDIEQLINRIMASSFPEDIESRYEQLRSEIRRQFDTFSEQSLNFDPSLRAFADQTFGKIDFALKTFESKLFTEHKRKSTDLREKIYRLQNALWPNGAFQDRALNVANFVARYGFGFVSWLYDSIDPFAPGPKLISLSEEKSK